MTECFAVRLAIKEALNCISAQYSQADNQWGYYHFC